ncbi:amino acid ABC transporter permease [Ammoniphilus sp. CFH 90114]|uniref:amino acid ABC transporter permease n=1 Tax=Ammoniphilus sp. CFH 90114 TaxID=2493665 RepID=UPI00100FD9FA|nr:amino acid ABC transporter permease [Ammoniphilus sp. CFH 90114]RXT07103.1 amino acid ABC transporter permease [Ammoniphilus sp. CFH 90114]
MDELIHAFFNWPILKESFPFLLKGVWVTIKLSFFSILFGIILGLVLAFIRTLGNPVVNAMIVFYIDVLRALPLLVLLVFVYYALPYLGISLSPYPAGILSFTLISSAYVAEIFRSGIEAIPKGQMEAARSIGLTYFQAMRFVVLPQAFKIVIPPLTNNSINVLKDTSLASVIALPELLKQAQQVQAWKANPTPLIGATILYLILLIPLVKWANRLERRMSKS